MKRLAIAAILLTTLLLIIAGCKPIGKAITLPNFTVNEIKDFPKQFLNATTTTISYNSVIMAPTGYTSETNDLLNQMKNAACNIVNNQGQTCVDQQGNPITGGVVASLTGFAALPKPSPLTGAAVSGQLFPPDTRPIYRCWYNFHGVVNHFLSFEANCGGDAVDGLIGHLYMAQKPNTVALHQCRRGLRHEHRTYYDHFVSTDANCEGNEYVNLLGYAPTSLIDETKAVYRCWASESINAGRFDHMLSDQVGCEGYRNEGITFYFFTVQ